MWNLSETLSRNCQRIYFWTGGVAPLSSEREDEDKPRLLGKKNTTENEFLAEFKTAEGGTYTIRVVKQGEKKQESEK